MDYFQWIVSLRGANAMLRNVWSLVASSPQVITSSAVSACFKTLQRGSKAPESKNSNAVQLPRLTLLPRVLRIPSPRTPSPPPRNSVHDLSSFSPRQSRTPTGNSPRTSYSPRLSISSIIRPEPQQQEGINQTASSSKSSFGLKTASHSFSGPPLPTLDPTGRLYLASRLYFLV